MRGQISIEMILILAAILAIAFLLVSQLQKTAEKAGDMVDTKTTQILDIANKSPGDESGDEEFSGGRPFESGVWVL